MRACSRRSGRRVEPLARRRPARHSAQHPPLPHGEARAEPARHCLVAGARLARRSGLGCRRRARARRPCRKAGPPPASLGAAPRDVAPRLGSGRPGGTRVRRIPAGRWRSSSTRSEASAGRSTRSAPAGLVAAFGLEPLEDAPRHAAYCRARDPESRRGRAHGSPGISGVALAIHTERRPRRAIPAWHGRCRREAAALADPRGAGRSRGPGRDARERAGGGASWPAASSSAGRGPWPDRRARSTGWSAPPVAERDSTGSSAARPSSASSRERFEQARAGQGQSCPSSASRASGSLASSASFAGREVDGGAWLEGQAMPSARPCPFTR